MYIATNTQQKGVIEMELTKYTTFTKQGKEFDVYVDSFGRIHIKMGDLTSICDINVNKKHGWYYVLRSDTTIAKELNPKKRGVNLVDPSAEHVRKFAEKFAEEHNIRLIEEKISKLSDDTPVVITQVETGTKFIEIDGQRSVHKHPLFKNISKLTLDAMTEITGVEKTREAYVSSTYLHITLSDLKKIAEVANKKNDAEENRRMQENINSKKEFENKLIQAQTTKKKVELCRVDFAEECTDPHIDCDFYDHVTYILPSGDTETVREERF